MRPTLRELGLALGELPPGPRNSIADVPGVRVGHVTLGHGEGPLVVGRGPVRTGLTAVVPPGEGPWPAAQHVINGFGKTVGLVQVEELGELESPVFLTNTLSVGAVLEGYLRHLRDEGRFDPGRSRNVVVAECNDGHLNDLWGLHVRPEHVPAALADARADFAQGSVGAGFGMAAFGWKGGIGSASRRLPGGVTVGALVLLNCGAPGELRLAGRALPRPPGPPSPPGSVILVIATDATGDVLVLRRMARRTVHGLARLGAIAHHGSGDIALAFAVPGAAPAPTNLDLLFQATVEATEEAAWNALATAETVVGRDGHRREAIPLDLLLVDGRPGT